MLSYETRLGEIKISYEYLAKLIGNAVTSCYGVVGMAPGGKKQQLFNILNKKDYAEKGIVVKGNADAITVDLHIIVLYGMNINAIAKSIVNKVKFTIAEATGIKVTKITVKVDGIKE